MTHTRHLHITSDVEVYGVVRDRREHLLTEKETPFHRTARPSRSFCEAGRRVSWEESPGRIPERQSISARGRNRFETQRRSYWEDVINDNPREDPVSVEITTADDEDGTPEGPAQKLGVGRRVAVVQVV